MQPGSDRGLLRLYQGPSRLPLQRDAEGGAENVQDKLRGRAVEAGHCNSVDYGKLSQGGRFEPARPQDGGLNSRMK